MLNFRFAILTNWFLNISKNGKSKKDKHGKKYVSKNLDKKNSTVSKKQSPEGLVEEAPVGAKLKSGYSGEKDSKGVKNGRGIFVYGMFT